VLLKGAYEQLGYVGRLKVEEGDVLIQPTFDCHTSRMLSQGLELIRLPWRRDITFGGIYRGCRIDVVLQEALWDVIAAAKLLEEELDRREPIIAVASHWTEELAIALAENPKLHIAAWAEAAHLSRERVSRGFAAVYRVPPGQFRSELNARAAWLRITGTREPLSKIAADLAFADQAHMTRVVGIFTGATPTQWRASHLFKIFEPNTATLDG
jgi:AraC-like DNA-binding protein